MYQCMLYKLHGPNLMYSVFLLPNRNLRRLNIEGNQLAGLPSTALSLPLTQLLPGDNYMHPLLWHENTRNQPQVNWLAKTDE